MKAADLNDALRIAHGTPYALTGGLYSRSPANIERVKREFQSAISTSTEESPLPVERQPFGGFRLSGIGTKAGGHDYLRDSCSPAA